MVKSKKPHISTQSSQGPHIKIGKYKADNVCLEEAAVDNLVLRVQLKGKTKVKERHKEAVIKETISSTSLKQMIQNSFKNKILSDSNGLKFINTVTEKPVRVMENLPKNDKRYCLKFLPPKFNISRIKINFKKLAQFIRLMKLPSQSWQVTVMMSNNFATVFNFTNHMPRRCVSFAENNPYYKIVMDGVPVVLLGCPSTVNTIRDIELLLDIVHRLSPNDCMVSKV